jgi:regulatory protein
MAVTDPRAQDPEARRRHAVDLAFGYLDRRDRTVLQMRRYLETKRVELETIEQTLAELVAGGWLDDARFASRFAEDRRRLDQWGAERIERRLLACGVAREVARDAVAREGAEGAHGELTRAVTVLHRRFPRPPADSADRRRAYGILLRKGYAPELASDALRAYARGDLE